VLGARAVATKVGTVPGLVTTRHTVEWAASIGDGVDVTVCSFVSSHKVSGGGGDIAEVAVVLLACFDCVVFGGSRGLVLPGDGETFGHVLRSWARTLLAVPGIPDVSTMFSGDASHVLKLLGREVQVVDTLDDAFGEWIVMAETLPREVLPSPRTIVREAVLRGARVHGPEDEVECGLNSNESGAESWHLGWGRLVAPGEQSAVDLLVTIIFCSLDVRRFHCTGVVLQEAGTHAFDASPRADVELVALAFAENEDINAPQVFWNDGGERQEPIDAWRGGSLDHVEKSFTEGDAELREQSSQMVTSRKNRTKARVDPVRDIETEPGEVKNERLDVGGVVCHLNGIAWCEWSAWRARGV